MSETSKSTLQETKDTTPKSEDNPSEQDRIDLTNQEHRHDLVEYVRGRIGAKYGSEYTKRCAATAAYTLNALRQLGPILTGLQPVESKKLRKLERPREMRLGLAILENILEQVRAVTTSGS